MARTLIQGGWVVSMDDAIGDTTTVSFDVTVGIRFGGGT